VGQPVTITLTNRSDRPLEFFGVWEIRNAKGENVASYAWRNDERTIAPGASRTWRWDGMPNHCGADGCTAVGDTPPAGKYQAVVRTRAGEITTDFLTGRYFTLGFESRPGTTFTVYVAKQKAVQQMDEEARSEEKTLIVSGIVQLGRRGYNSDWSFYMGPRSIVLGEMFIEVCDGSPYYVQRHRKEWKGQRWCPWSSYVMRAGR
jgi:hypothetical protein